MKSKNETMESLEEETSYTGVITLDDILGKQEEPAQKQEEKVTVVSVEVNSDTVSPAGMKEITVDAVGQKPLQMIENPLPVPKRREHKEMDFKLTDFPEDDDFDTLLFPLPDAPTIA